MFYIRLLLKLAFLMVVFALHGDEKVDKKANILVFPANKIHNGDYFAFSETVEISGTITGDLYVAGAQVFIDGNIQGDVLLVAGSADISGTVGGNIRALGGQVLLAS